MPTYGRQVLTPVVGYPLRVSADGNPVWKTGGVTIDWATVAAVASADATLINGQVVAVGQKALRYGQVITKITASGKFGPYDSTASDGRQLLVRGEIFVVNETILQNGPLAGLLSGPSDHPGVIEGGRVFYDRLLIGSATNELGAPTGPSVANFNAAFPDIQYVKN